MKIGVITLPLHNNFGGILQAYALQKALRRLGHKAVLIDRLKYLTVGPWYKKYPIYLKRAIQKHLLRKDIIVKVDAEINRVPKTIARNTDSFIDKHIKRVFTKDFTNIAEKDFNAIIVGSDQIWRPKYFFSTIENAYLDFAKEWSIKRIAYAASFGTDEWEYNDEQTRNCATLLKRFNAVSVRESSAVNLCKEKFAVRAEHLLDPTMLLEKKDYIRLMTRAKSDEKLFCYILDNGNEKEKIVDTISKAMCIVPFYINSKYEDEKAPLLERIQQPVEKWLRAFQDAEFVITDSFHACVFSIIFNKPFIVYGNKERGWTRFESLLKMFGLEERLVSSANEINRVLEKPINWDRVNLLHKKLKEKSLSFLKKNLEQ